MCFWNKKNTLRMYPNYIFVVNSRKYFVELVEYRFQWNLEKNILYTILCKFTEFSAKSKAVTKNYQFR